jgi:hypothetical protein
LYKSEGEMYPHVAQWLRHLLAQKFRHSTVVVEDTSKKVLSRFLVERGLHELFRDYQTYEIQVDVTGVVHNGKTAGLAFIECKLDKISLRDLSQLLGYSRVATPLVSIIISPEGISDAINLLFNTHRRNDILSYGDKGCIRIARWDENKRDINMQTLIPKGGLF